MILKYLDINLQNRQHLLISFLQSPLPLVYLKQWHLSDYVSSKGINETAVCKMTIDRVSMTSHEKMSPRFAADWRDPSREHGKLTRSRVPEAKSTRVSRYSSLAITSASRRYGCIVSASELRRIISFRVQLRQHEFVRFQDINHFLAI